jgi:hypothetical protein
MLQGYGDTVLRAETLEKEINKDRKHSAQKELNKARKSSSPSLMVPSPNTTMKYRTCRLRAMSWSARTSRCARRTRVY